LGHPGEVAYDPTLYSGAAAHYRPGRPPYAPELEPTLCRELGLDGTGRLLDVGCGPGILAVRLAPGFDEVVGLDPDPDMLTEARRAAAHRGVTNAGWVQAVAEDLPVAAPGPFRLVIFGQSFHWTDELRVAEVVYDLLEPGGALALVDHTVDGRPSPPSPGAPPIPHEEIEAVVDKYLGSRRRAGQGSSPARTRRAEEVLSRTRFGGSRTVFVPGTPDLIRDSQSVISGYLSLSWSAPHLYGDRIEAFTGEVGDLLSATSPSGQFWDWQGDTEVVLAEKPGSS
jgi:SAM-dependent methyltransferase